MDRIIRLDPTDRKGIEKCVEEIKKTTGAPPLRIDHMSGFYVLRDAM